MLITNLLLSSIFEMQKGLFRSVFLFEFYRLIDLKMTQFDRSNFDSVLGCREIGVLWLILNES